MSRCRSVLVAMGAVVVRPSLWWTAVVEVVRFVPDGWWRTRPWLPLPAPEMLRFRAVTQYGDPDHPPAPDDIVTWLRWCKAENQRRRIG